MSAYTPFAPAAALACLLVAGPASAAGETNPDLEFFKEEAEVVTASRRPQPVRQAPATVYVVTAEDIWDSGAQTLWDALRTVPGVDVMSARTAQGEVSIRGLDKPQSNRTLVLLDGKTVLNSYFDFVVWEEIPVTLEEIDRIEVVEGPVSALYGANAVNGVINIITKTPEQLKGGVVRYRVGERSTQMGTALYGNSKGKASYKVGLGWDSTRRFEDGSLRASEAGKVHALAGYAPAKDTTLSLSGGFADIYTQISGAGSGPLIADGPSGFVRADVKHRETSLRLFWNHGGERGKDFFALQEPRLLYNTYDADLEHYLKLPFANSLTVGGNYRKNTARSTAFSQGSPEQDLWALFFEDEWRLLDHWSVVGSGRLDRHPFTPLLFSPRASVIFTPVPEHTLRFSAGNSFRNPTLLENYLNLVRTDPNPGGGLPNPPFANVQTTILGTRGLSPERLTMYEAAHIGRFGPVKTTLTAFHYRLKDVLAATTPTPTCTLACIPTAKVQTSFINGGEIKAWGGEGDVQLLMGRGVTTFANYSYESLTDHQTGQAPNTPRHKANAGLRVKRSGFAFSLWADWVGATSWNQNPPATGANSYIKVPDYTLVNAGVRYEFAGRWDGLEAGLSAFNLLDRAHFELLPSQSAGFPGQAGEVIRARWVGSLSYRF